MRVFEEFWTFVAAVGATLVLVALAAVLLSYFNPQQPLDHAKAAFYPLVKPANATHVLLGVKPYADGVAVVSVAYQHGGRWVEVPTRPTTVNKTAWLNTTDGRAVAVPCGSNVTVVTRYGSASRALSFYTACLQRDVERRTSAESILQQLLDYAAYVSNYLIYQSVPAVAAYLKFSSTIRIIFEVTLIEIGLQNIAPFPLMVYNISTTTQPGDLWPGQRVYTDLFTLMPQEIKPVYNIIPYENRFTAYRWLHIVAHWNETLTVWINGVLIYNGTFRSFSTTSPQGFGVGFDASTKKLTVTLVDHSYNTNRVQIDVKPGVSEWSGWAYWGQAWLPSSNFGYVKSFYVMPGGVKAGQYIGVIPPFRVYSVYAVYNGSGVVASWLDPKCGFGDECLQTAFYRQPGTYQLPVNVTLIWNSTGVYLRNKYGTTKGSIPFRIELDVSNAYRYELNFTSRYAKKLLYCRPCYFYYTCCYYNATTLGIFTLKYNNQTVAYDAYYGHTIYGRTENQPPRSGGEIWPMGDYRSGCYPKVDVIPLGQRHSGLVPIRKDGRIVGYQVTVENVYKARYYGCGWEREGIYNPCGHLHSG